MKWLIGLLGLVVVLLMAGCEGGVSYGGAYGVYGEYPYTYYGSGGYYPAPLYVYPYPYHYHRHFRAPYDRDHYFEQGHFHEGHVEGGHFHEGNVEGGHEFGGHHGRGAGEHSDRH